MTLTFRQIKDILCYFGTIFFILLLIIVIHILPMKRICLALCVCFISAFSTAQVTIKITQVPTNTPVNDKIFVAGTFNGWNPMSSEHVMTKEVDGKYYLTFTPSIGNHMYKCTRGSWDKVEGNDAGEFIGNRSFTYNGVAKTIEIKIDGWEGSNTISTASSQVSILSDTFFIPQLLKKRRIWLYLPKNYSSFQERYPVLYMHDGQNLFDRSTSFSGEWGVDESLDSLNSIGFRNIIIVGIDNGGGDRIAEYSPWINEQYGGGKGDKYVEFIVTTLKPYIDSHYRTLPQPSQTGIMGSSLGGLISMYAGIEYPSIFGKIGVFSPAFWFAPQCYTHATTKGVGADSKIYMIAGAKEGANVIGDMNKMVEKLQASGASIDQYLAIPHPDGEHKEWYWRREFPEAIKWLFGAQINNTKEKTEKTMITVRVVDEKVKLVHPTIQSGTLLELFNYEGQKVYTTILDEDLSFYPENLHGIFVLKLEGYPGILIRL
jgi:metallo-beta-lactamase class B